MRTPLPTGQQRIRRYRGQSVVVTCRETGQRLRITLSAVRDHGPGSCSLLAEDPADHFDIQPAESYLPAVTPAEAAAKGLDDRLRAAESALAEASATLEALRAALGGKPGK